MVRLVKEYYIEAAHRVPESGDEGGMRLHGHSFRIEIIVEGEIDPAYGWAIDFGLITKAFAPLRAQLDHHCLNDIPGIESGWTHALEEWLRVRLAPSLPGLCGVRVSIVGDNAFVPVTLPADAGLRLPPRLRFMFEAAQQLPHLPEEHPCRNLHGHTYRVEVGAKNLVRLEPALRTIYSALDHRCLNDVEGLGEATSERLCEWIWRTLSEHIDDLLVVVVQETATARCIYHGR